MREAFEAYGHRLKPLPAQEMPLRRALHRSLAADVTSAMELPPFRQSAMDGFALSAGETMSAAAESPARLHVVGTVPAGRLESAPRIGTGEAMQIFTGGYVPDGADAVLRQEDAQLDDAWLLVGRPVKRGENVRQAGEELARGTVIATRGARMTAGLIGALSVTGVEAVTVHREPRVTVLTTGDEVVEPGTALKLGEIYDANSHLVVAWLQELGYSHVSADHLPDDLAGTERALRAALASSDLVIATGGVSVGERDFVPPAARNVGMEEVFWRVRQKPGKPLFFAASDSAPLIGLPGNPGAVFVSLAVHVRRILDTLEGVREPGPRFSVATLGFHHPADAKRDHWLRCRAVAAADGAVRLEPLPRQASHMISNLAHCDALAWIPAGAGEMQPGQRVRWAACGPMASPPAADEA